MCEFTHQVILITGASSGIGKALACALAPHSPKLVLVARDRSRLQKVAHHLLKPVANRTCDSH